MRRTISLTILGLTLLTIAASSHNQTPMVYLIGFLAGLALYCIAVAFLFAAAASAASPLIVAYAFWLWRRHRQRKPLPRWLKSLRRRVASHLPVLTRITASGRAAKHAWRQNTGSEPATCGDRAAEPPDGCASAAA